MAYNKAMRVEKFSFGKIVIDGRTYTNDLIVTPAGLITEWWRREGHVMDLEDFDSVDFGSAECVILGTGQMGVVRVADRLLRHLDSLGLRVHVARSAEAVELYNSAPDRTILAIHLTC